MRKVAVIGGGTSGLSAAIFASGNDTEVTVLERNTSCGKKLLLTGNGKCNYWNKDQNINHYHSEFRDALMVIFTEENLSLTFNFISSLGIVPFIKNGYYYPFSNQAITMKNALLIESRRKKVSFVCECFVEEIVKVNDKFILKTNKGNMEFDDVIVATGSKAFPKTGSDGNGYNLLKRLGHKIENVKPSLVQIELNERFLKKWQGIRTHAKVSLIENNTLIREEEGELQLTDYGVSGICIFNLSRFVNSLCKQFLLINFFPFVEENPFLFLEKQNKIVPDRTVGELLESILNYKLVLLLLEECSIPYDSYFNDLNRLQKEKLITTFTNFKVEIVGTKSYEFSQVCAGGVSLEEIDLKTCESKIVSNLYIVGELLDIDGDCGGYNLTNAFLTGMLAGKGVKDKIDKN